MGDEHIVVLRDLRLMDARSRPIHCLYYYQGNYYHPLDIYGGDAGRIKRAIREFEKEHRAMVEADRKSPSYKTKVELFDEQMEAVDGAQIVTAQNQAGGVQGMAPEVGL